MTLNIVEHWNGLPATALTQIEQLSKHIEQLEIENRDLKNEVASLKQHFQTDEHFVRHAGALWERNRAGGIEPFPLCPSCKLPMCCPEILAPYDCSHCNIKSGFRGRDLHEVVAEIPRLIGSRATEPVNSPASVEITGYGHA